MGPIISHQQITCQEITPELIASDRLLLGNLLTAYQQAIPILPQGNYAVLIQETQRDCSETNRWHSRWDILSTARVGSLITYLTTVWISPEDELKRCTSELQETTKQHSQRGIWLHQHHLTAKVLLINFMMELWYQCNCKAFVCVTKWSNFTCQILFAKSSASVLYTCTHSAFKQNLRYPYMLNIKLSFLRNPIFVWHY